MGGLSYTHGLIQDDYQVRFREAGFGMAEETVGRAATRTLDVQVGAGLELRLDLSLNASLSLEQDLTKSPGVEDVEQTGRIAVS